MLARIFAYCLAIPVALTPMPLRLWLADRLGDLLRRALGSRRKIAAANLAQAFPDLDDAARAALLRDHFRHLGRLGVAMFEQPLYGWFPGLFHRKASAEGLDLIRAAKAASATPPILLGSHLGSWEGLGAVICAFPDQTVSIYKRGRGFAADYIDVTRAHWPTRLIEKHEAREGLAAGLREGLMPGLLSDQGGSTEYMFFGRPARFPHGGAHIWAETGAPAFLCIGICQPDGGVRCQVDPLPLPPWDQVDPGDRKRVFVEAYVAGLEAAIRKHPAQYFWVHDLWRLFKRD